MLNNYNIRDDYYVERYFEDKDLSDETEKTYVKGLKKFCEAVDKELKDIIDDCKAQQNIEMEEILSSTNDNGNTIIQKKVTKFDVDGADSLVLQHFNQFVKYCKSKNNKNTTINSGLDTIRAVLSHFKVELPKFPNLQNDADNWELLSKEDFKFVLADSSLMHRSLILFMLSSGLRITDCLNLTIGDYMEATSDYHNFVEVKDFINNAPDDMRGYWDFTPNKTKKKSVICKTFNSFESNKFILQNLRRVQNEYMPRKSKKIHKELKLTKSDSLFGSKRGFYKKSPEVFSISTMFGHKNKKLYDWHINQIKQDIKDGKISDEDYDKYVELIPKFHPHACRKYFITTIERHTSNERRYRLMEGHAPSNKIDKSYINISKTEIAEVYDSAEIDLSVYRDNNEDLNKLRDDFEKKFNSQEEKHKQEIEFLKKKHQNEIIKLRADINKEIDVLDKKIDDSGIIPLDKLWEAMVNYNMDRGANLLFESLANDKKSLDESIVDSMEDKDPLLIRFIDDLANVIKNNYGIMKIIGSLDISKFEHLAEVYLINSGIISDVSNVDLSNISYEDINRIAGAVLMLYLAKD